MLIINLRGLTRNYLSDYQILNKTYGHMQAQLRIPRVLLVSSSVILISYFITSKIILIENTLN